ncbi:MAG: 50S ribosomal protein L30 [Chloroflexi bacterium]|nr:MAG: 50S ribosomal protein L30 [Chloroflexota bacterium]
MRWSVSAGAARSRSLWPHQPSRKLRSRSQSADMARLKITYVRSVIGQKPDQERTVQALGFRRLNQTVEHEDSPQLRGMVHKVRHLVKVEETA